MSTSGGTVPASLTIPALDARYDKRNALVFRPETFGAIGDGTADDTAAVRAAFDAANAAARVGLSASILHPGATVQLTGTYNLMSLAAPIVVTCNVENSRAAFLVPATYAGVTVLVGRSTSGDYFQAADIRLPDVIKPTGTAIVAGSVAVRLQNLGNSIVALGRTYYHETGLHLTGWNQGTVYNTIFPGHLSYDKIAIDIRPHLAGGWANQNTFIGGGIQQSTGYAGGTRVAGWRHVRIDGNGINACDMNRFIGVSFEGDVSEYHIELRQCNNNRFEGNRFEQGTLGTAVTVSGSTLTAVAHGLAVGDMVTFSAGTTPGGMFLLTGYFVVSTPTADTFTVSQKKAGTAVTFSSAGATVVYFKPPRILLDTTGSLTANNTGDQFFAIQGVLELIDAVGAGTGNVFHPAGIRIADNYLPEDLPMYRGRNRFSGAVTRPIFAAYPPSAKPSDDPNGWTTALSDRGVVHASAGAELGVVGNAFGTLTYKRPADTVAYEVPSARRTPGLITITTLSCPANTTTSTTFTLTDAAVNDHVNITMLSHVAGIAVSHGYISSANTVTVVFANLTAGTISLSTTLQAIATRRFY